MLLDAEQLEDGALLEAKVIIAGGGMAGLLLARQLGDAGIDVLVLESGGQSQDARVQSMYAGKMTLGGPSNSQRTMDGYLIASRVRCLGGSGNVWGGKCAPLDPLDFERRDWIAHSGWPLTRSTMQPFYDRACDVLELPHFSVDAQAMTGAPEPLFASGPRRFTARPRGYTRCSGAVANSTYQDYKVAAANHERVRIYLKANLTRIEMSEDGERVAALDVRCLNGRTHRARAHTYILAMGGIENARLLLASSDVHRNGIGNHSDWLGRGFQGHAVIEKEGQTSVQLLRNSAVLAPFDVMNRSKVHIVLGASDDTQRALRGVNFTVTLPRAIGAVTGAPAAALAVAKKLASASTSERREAYFMIEHTPNRESRLSLIRDELDELQMPRVRLDMRFGAAELDRFMPTLAMFASELGRCEAGRVQWRGGAEDLVASMSLSRHHMGATRMAVSAKSGVVDEHCRVHGVQNLYVAGSSVFPTSGIANPTLTLLALALRLSDHLRGRIST
ncbi:GMC family oxidoreductase [Steroidobacter sp. S1-65]|uniref:GMC family oxidoreductase n=1 Tax=Steroidobacter gossypii TaxID=2805490 RepID=A0ABS1WR14_9GAMM|nr:GMC family oxidoreductase [Steroidobacter gossypii]MBM0103401.1 GMC family oxidoreductase [Steroidobacter gossypii]